MSGYASGQGIERYSLAGETAAEGLHGAPSTQPYNLQIGPVALRADAGSTVTYNDNINLAKTGKQSDWIVAPEINITGLWQVTELNELTFNLGVSYQTYLSHSSYDNFQIAPNSQTQFAIFVGDFKIILHDTFSYQQDPIQIGQLSNVAQFGHFDNDAGVKGDWDLGDITASLIYDHHNFWVSQQAYQYLDYQSDTITPQVTFKLSKTISAGLNASFSSMRYDQSGQSHPTIQNVATNQNIQAFQNDQGVQNDSTQFQLGGFVSAQFSENLSVQAQAGWEFATYAQGGLNGDTKGIDSPDASVGVTHRINDAVTESLTAGREFTPGVTSNYTQRTYVNYTPDWHATTLFDIAPQIWWENLDDSAATIRENSERFGASLDLSFALTQHSTVNFNYNYVIKSSNESALNYQQNVVSLGLIYQF